MNDRDLTLRPFSNESFWNTPIGSEASYQSGADLETATLRYQEGVTPWIGASAMSVYRSNASDPLMRWTYSGRSGSEPWLASDPIGTVWIKTPVDVQFRTEDGWAIIVSEDGQYFYETWMGSYNPSTNSYHAEFLVKNALGSDGSASQMGTSEGIRAGGMSLLGGLVRKHELDALAIDHAIAMAISTSQAKQAESQDLQFVWPATIADRDSVDVYAGSIPMGAMFAIPLGVDLTKIGLKTPEGMALARAYQNYGGYVTDNAGSSTLQVAYLEAGASEDQINNLLTDVATIRDQLVMVTNSTAAHPGGPGTRVTEPVGPSDTVDFDLESDTSRDDSAGVSNSDTVISSVSFNLEGSEAIRLELAGFADLIAIGNDKSNFILGNRGSNLIDGRAGDDTIDGGDGPDTMSGGRGNDLYYVDNSGDRIIERPRGGLDTVVSAISFSLAGKELENLWLVGFLNSRAIGNNKANVIRGNDKNNLLAGAAGDDTLIGGRGADRMEGGKGDDYYVVDHTKDRVLELTRNGVDSVKSAVSFGLAGSHVENLRLIEKATKGVGNSLNNAIVGNAANNKIVGGGGSDRLTGGSGHDTLSGGADTDVLVGGSGNDVFLFDAQWYSGVDVIKDFAVSKDKIAVRSTHFPNIGRDAMLNGDGFCIGAQAIDGSDRLIYNNLTGALYYDPDGSGSAEPLQFARVAAGLKLSASDFILI